MPLRGKREEAGGKRSPPRISGALVTKATNTCFTEELALSARVGESVTAFSPKSLHDFGLATAGQISNFGSTTP